MFLGGKKVCDPKKQFVTQRGEEMRAHQVAAWGSDGKTTPPCSGWDAGLEDERTFQPC